MKLRLVSLALVAAFVGAVVVGAAGASAQRNQAGARGLVNAIVQLVATDVVDITDSTVQVGLVNVDDSLNNLRALNNVLNNSPILSDNTIVVTDVIDIGDVSVLNGAQITALNNFLNANDVDVDAIVGVAVLSSQDLILISR